MNRFSRSSRGTAEAGTDPAPPTPRWRGRRALLVLVAISIGWKVLLLGVGGTVVTLLVDDGLSAVPRELQPYGAEAIRTARALWAGPIDRHGVRGVRVMSVERLAGGSAARCGGLTARVRAYTFFAIPYSEVRTVCDRGIVQYRVLPHRTRAN